MPTYLEFSRLLFRILHFGRAAVMIPGGGVGLPTPPPGIFWAARPRWWWGWFWPSSAAERVRRHGLQAKGLTAGFYCLSKLLRKMVSPPPPPAAPPPLGKNPEVTPGTRPNSLLLKSSVNTSAVCGSPVGGNSPLL